ncbi:Fanconi-associated nuclease 1-like protein [Diplonema papillatum]|nr:Fanconi-associated nuclease 1-like protein [Diplonema papillatum]
MERERLPIQLRDVHVLIDDALHKDRHLLTDAEASALGQFLRLRLNSQLLAVRLYNRKRQWIRVEKLEYDEISDRHDAALGLVEAGLASGFGLGGRRETLDDEEVARGVVTALQAAEIRDVLKQFKVHGAAMLSRQGAEAKLLGMLSERGERLPDGQTQLPFATGSNPARRKKLTREAVAKAAGPCLHLDEAFRRPFCLAHRLFLMQHPSDELETITEDTQHAAPYPNGHLPLVVLCGMWKWPVYQPRHLRSDANSGGSPPLHGEAAQTPFKSLNESDSSPLHQAVACSDAALVKTSNKNDSSPFQQAVACSDTALVKTSNESDSSSLQQVAACGEAALFKTSNESDSSPLRQAAACSDTGLVHTSNDSKPPNPGPPAEHGGPALLEAPPGGDPSAALFSTSLFATRAEYDGYTAAVDALRAIARETVELTRHKDREASYAVVAPLAKKLASDLLLKWRTSSPSTTTCPNPEADCWCPPSEFHPKPVHAQHAHCDDPVPEAVFLFQQQQQQPPGGDEIEQQPATNGSTAAAAKRESSGAGTVRIDTTVAQHLRGSGAAKTAIVGHEVIGIDVDEIEQQPATNGSTAAVVKRESSGTAGTVRVDASVAQHLRESGAAKTATVGHEVIGIDVDEIEQQPATNGSTADVVKRESSGTAGTVRVDASVAQHLRESGAAKTATVGHEVIGIDVDEIEQQPATNGSTAAVVKRESSGTAGTVRVDASVAQHLRESGAAKTAIMGHEVIGIDVDGIEEQPATNGSTADVVKRESSGASVASAAAKTATVGHEVLGIDVDEVEDQLAANGSTAAAAVKSGPPEKTAVRHSPSTLLRGNEARREVIGIDVDETDQRRPPTKRPAAAAIDVDVGGSGGEGTGPAPPPGPPKRAKRAENVIVLSDDQPEEGRAPPANPHSRPARKRRKLPQSGAEPRQGREPAPGFDFWRQPPAVSSVRPLSRKPVEDRRRGGGWKAGWSKARGAGVGLEARRPGPPAAAFASDDPFLASDNEDAGLSRWAQPELATPSGNAERSTAAPPPGVPFPGVNPARQLQAGDVPTGGGSPVDHADPLGLPLGGQNAGVGTPSHPLSTDEGVPHVVETAPAHDEAQVRNNSSSSSSRRSNNLYGATDTARLVESDGESEFSFEGRDTVEVRLPAEGATGKGPRCCACGVFHDEEELSRIVFSADYVKRMALTVAVDVFESVKKYALSARVLQLILACNAFRPRRRGRFWQRLAIDLGHLNHGPATLRRVVARSLSEAPSAFMAASDRLWLERRLARLAAKAAKTAAAEAADDGEASALFSSVPARRPVPSLPEGFTKVVEPEVRVVKGKRYRMGKAVAWDLRSCAVTQTTPGDERYSSTRGSRGGERSNDDDDGDRRTSQRQTTPPAENASLVPAALAVPDGGAAFAADVGLAALLDLEAQLQQQQQLQLPPHHRGAAASEAAGAAFPPGNNPRSPPGSFGSPPNDGGDGRPLLCPTNTICHDQDQKPIDGSAQSPLPLEEENRLEESAHEQFAPNDAELDVLLDMEDQLHLHDDDHHHHHLEHNDMAAATMLQALTPEKKKDRGEEGAEKEEALDRTAKGLLRGGVEAAALHAICKERGSAWTGTHCEGARLRFVVVLLMWDVLFDVSTAGARAMFPVRFMLRPLDYGTPRFAARGRAVGARTALIAAWSSPQICAEVERSYLLHKDVRAINCSWDTPLVEAVNLASCLTPRQLASLCHSMCTEMQLSGMPDLTLYDPVTSSILLSEVKGPGDSLSTKQEIWLTRFREMDIPAEVCHVVDLEQEAAKAAKAAETEALKAAKAAERESAKKAVAASRASKKRKAAEVTGGAAEEHADEGDVVVVDKAEAEAKGKSGTASKRKKAKGL